MLTYGSELIPPAWPHRWSPLSPGPWWGVLVSPPTPPPHSCRVQGTSLSGYGCVLGDPTSHGLSLGPECLVEGHGPREGVGMG